MATSLPAASAGYVAQGQRPEGVTEDQGIVSEFRTEPHRTSFFSDAKYQATKRRFGERGVAPPRPDPRR